MHCALLGVTRQFLELWMECTGSPYYVGKPKDFRSIDDRLCKIDSQQFHETSTFTFAVQVLEGIRISEMVAELQPPLLVWHTTKAVFEPLLSSGH